MGASVLPFRHFFDFYGGTKVHKNVDYLIDLKFLKFSSV